MPIDIKNYNNFLYRKEKKILKINSGEFFENNIEIFCKLHFILKKST